MVEKVHFGP
jgi:hypothetical protein